MLLAAAFALTTVLATGTGTVPLPAPGHPSPCSRSVPACPSRGTQDLGIAVFLNGHGGRLFALTNLEFKLLVHQALLYMCRMSSGWLTTANTSSSFNRRISPPSIGMRAPA